MTRKRRASLSDITGGFCGWPFLLDIIKKCEETEYLPSPVWETDLRESEYQRHLIERDQALIATLFETGGRVAEVVRLRSKHFNIRERWITVTSMPLLKRYRKDRNTGRTIPKKETRGTIAIPRDEPLVPYMMNWILKQDDYVFPSPKKGKKHISTTRVYQIIRSLSDRMNVYDISGEKIYFFPHWLRAQRASQLAEEYNFTLHQLLRFFAWKNIETATRYANLSTEALQKAMRPDWPIEGI